MEYNLSETEPSSTGESFYQEVREKSEFCDVTIRMGHWEMAFHWCVLMASPFFENIYKNGFVEKKRGQVHLHVGTPSAVEASLLFLYGKKPHLTDDNVSGILEVAEFLLIPNLKATSIKWMESQSVTEANCYKHLELSSIYDFELSDCTRFIRSNLPEMFQKNEMLNITYDSVKYILSDPTLSYFGMEEKFRLLTRWTKALQDRLSYLSELIQLIRLEDMSHDFIETVVKTEPLLADQYIENYFARLSIDCINDEDMKKVVIIKSTRYSLICLDLQRKMYYRVGITNQEEEHMDYQNEETQGGMAMHLTDFYKVKQPFKYYRTLLINNLATDQTMKTTIEGENIDMTNSSLIVGCEECYVVTKETEKIPPIHIKNSDKIDKEENDHTDKTVSSNKLTADKDRFDYSIAEHVLKQSLPSQHVPPSHIVVTRVFKGTLKEGITAVHPLLAVRNLSYTKCCVNKAKIIAILSDDDNTIYLYDQNSRELDKFLLRTEYDLEIGCDDKLAPTTEGFVIYNDHRAFCLTRSTSPSLLMSYKTYLYEFDNENKSMTLVFCENQWFRYFQYGSREESIFSYAAHDEILATKEGHEISWVDLPNPDNTTSIGSNMFAMFIPKGMVKCHLNCPHCEQANRVNDDCEQATRNLDDYNGIAYVDDDDLRDNLSANDEYNNEYNDDYGYNDEYDYDGYFFE